MTQNTTWPWLTEHGPLIAAISLGVALIALILPWIGSRFGTSSVLEEVKDTASRPILIERYTQSRGAGYRRWVGHALSAADRIYGPKLFSNQSITRSLQLAYAYPLLALLIGWVVFNAGTVGGLEILPDTFDTVGRSWRALVLIALAAFVAWVIASIDRFEAYVSGILTKIVETLDHRAGVLAKAARWSLHKFVVGAFVVAVFGVVVVVGVVVGAGVVVGVVVGVVGVFVFGVVVGVVGVFVFGVVAVVVVGGDPQEASILILFYLILPLLNGFADAASVAATRKLLPHIRDGRPSFWRIAAHSLIDLCIAALCLVALLASLWGILLVWETLAPFTLAFDWRGYRDAVMAGDWGQATILILMVLTTLVPTLIHLSFGLAGFWASQSPGYQRAVTALKAAQGDLSVAQANNITRDIRKGVFWGWFVGLITLTLPCLLIWQIITLTS